MILLYQNAPSAYFSYLQAAFLSSKCIFLARNLFFSKRNSYPKPTWSFLWCEFLGLEKYVDEHPKNWVKYQS